jgi:hypothetical protein
MKYWCGLSANFIVSQSHDTAIWADHPTVSQKTVVVDQVIELFPLLDVKAYTNIQGATIK